MNAIILSIGDELLIGNTLNTNSFWLGNKLTQLGINVIAHWTIADTKEAIKSNINSAQNLAQIILITGGLGPTSDDLTVEAIAEYYNQPLVFHDSVWDDIQKLYAIRKRPIHLGSKKMAYLPKNAIVIHNTTGTAPGSMYFSKNTLIASMPGVPYEMKAMMRLTIIPTIKNHFTLPFIHHSYIYTAGVGETILSDALVDFEKHLPSHFSLAYLPSVGKVRLRITGKGETEQKLNEEAKLLTKNAASLVQKYIYSISEPSLEKVLGQVLREKKLQIGTAESCTGGYISHLITQIPGASDYFKGSIVSYSNEVKISILNVHPDTIKEYGAVSEETVQEMLLGALKSLNTDIVIAVSGVAGPGGGSIEKPVGLVYIGVADKRHQIIKKMHFTNNRELNIELSAIQSLVLLKVFLETYYEVNFLSEV
ncbi:MAG: CinA family nicotinamide mononucleotide deamidase-related protein [Chitinophagales bacterium]|nr:CinA family nicotinamide mononucleotide deamidase-related protein [Chitinophagales bacterium]MCZ2393493.1 CinA family nicotinamide mononucleotide deamidase-related protein [Chitinophagales bacterium]